MDVRDLSRIDLAMLCVAVGPSRKALVSIVFGAIIHECGLDLRIERDGRDYVLVCIELRGEAIVAEHRLPIVWQGLDEDVRVAVLGLYLDALLDGHRRWCRRMASRLAALGVGVQALPAND